MLCYGAMIITAFFLSVVLLDKAAAEGEKGCGTTLGCYEAYQQHCNHENFQQIKASWKMLPSNKMFVMITSNETLGKNQYIAVGFSFDSRMGNESVIECSKLGSTRLSMKFSYNDRRGFNTRIKGEETVRSTLMSNETVRFFDGGMNCSCVIDLSGDSSKPEIFHHDPKLTYYPIVAGGRTNSSGLLKHVDRCASPLPRNLSDYSVPELFKNETCGTTKGCILCGSLKFSWKLLSNTKMLIELRGAANIESLKNQWVAVGFSNDDEMGNDNIIECSSFGKYPLSFKFSYNVDRGVNARIIDEPNIRKRLVSNETAIVIDGVIYCTAVIDVSGVPEKERVFRYIPNKSYYILVASGAATGMSIGYHKEKCASPTPLNMETFVPPMKFDKSKCGKSKSCFISQDKECGGRAKQELRTSWKVISDDKIFVELFGKAVEAQRWIAIGFSNDVLMGNESVIECSKLGNETRGMKFSFNIPSQTNIRIQGEENIRTQYFSNVTTSFIDGHVYCSGYVKVSGHPSMPQVFRYVPGRPHYIFVAAGPTSLTGLERPDNKCVSSKKFYLEKIDVQEPPEFDVSGCGKTKACYISKNADCQSGAFLKLRAAWKVLSKTRMWVELYGETAKSDRWLAIGFSNDNRMGNESVLECSKLIGGNRTWKYSFNIPAQTNNRIEGEANIHGFKNQTMSLMKGALYCSAVVDVSGYASMPEVFRYVPNRPHYIFVAAGETHTTGLLRPDNKCRSPRMYYLDSLEPIPSKTDLKNWSNSKKPGTFECLECGKTYSCFFPDSCEENNLGVAYRIDGDVMELDLIAPISSNGSYVAVGFNTHDVMDGAYVIECSSIASAPLSLQFSYNVGKKNKRIPTIEHVQRSYFLYTKYETISGMVHCKAMVNVSGYSKSSQVFHYDKELMYYVMIAMGPTSAKWKGLGRHTSRAISAAAVNLAEIINISTEKWRIRLVKAHAILMILAWFCFIPMGILFARMLRNSWPLIKPFDLLLWFHVHRATNICGIVCMVASFICILTSKSWQWSGPGRDDGHMHSGSKNLSWTEVHTVVGLMSLIMAWIQPFISAVRCTPSDPRRPVFNWLHRAMGFLAFALATTAISIAGYHFKGIWNKPQLTLALALVPIGLIFVISVVSFLFYCPFIYEKLTHGNHMEPSEYALDYEEIPKEKREDGGKDKSAKKTKDKKKKKPKAKKRQREKNEPISAGVEEEREEEHMDLWQVAQLGGEELESATSMSKSKSQVSLSKVVLMPAESQTGLENQVTTTDASKVDMIVPKKKKEKVKGERTAKAEKDREISKMILLKKIDGKEKELLEEKGKLEKRHSEELTKIKTVHALEIEKEKQRERLLKEEKDSEKRKEAEKIKAELIKQMIVFIVMAVLLADAGALCVLVAYGI